MSGLFRKIIVIFALLIAADGLAAQVKSGSAAPPAAGAARQDEIERIAQEAREALNKRDWEAAIRGYERLVKTAPDVPENRLNLGIALFSAGRPFDAIQPLRQALKLKPGLAQSRFYLGASLGEAGQCREALPYLKQDLPRVTDRDLKRAVGLGGIKCAVALERFDDAVDFARVLNRTFPDDPEVLYRTVHLYSDLSTRASVRLLFKAPASYQVHELNAEALETQGKWEDAEKEYRKILEDNPNLPGIHYRLGRILLSAPETATSRDEARREFEQELKIDPGNAAAEFVLGELSFQAGKVEESVGYFSRAVKLDDSFVDAYLELGRALTSTGKAAEALRPLEAAVRLQPENAMTHFRLATAYASVGRKEDGQKEMGIYRDLTEKQRQEKETIQKTISGVPPDRP